MFSQWPSSALHSRHGLLNVLTQSKTISQWKWSLNKQTLKDCSTISSISQWSLSDLSMNVKFLKMAERSTSVKGSPTEASFSLRDRANFVLRAPNTIRIISESMLYSHSRQHAIHYNRYRAQCRGSRPCYLWLSPQVACVFWDAGCLVVSTWWHYSSCCTVSWVGGAVDLPGPPA